MLAWIVDYGTFSRTGRTSLLYGKKSRTAPDLPRTLTCRTSFAARTGCSPATVTFRAGFIVPEPDVGLATVNGILEVDFKVIAEACSVVVLSAS